MSEMLFEMEEVKSPRLLWMERHGVTTREVTEWEFKTLAGWEYRWVAMTWDEPKGFGGTEDEALAQAAINLGVLLWNEEQEPPRSGGARAAGDWDFPIF